MSVVPQRHQWPALLLAAALLLAPLVLPVSLVNALNYVGMNALVCLGLVMLTGFAGVVSFGQAAFVGVGAYASALLTTHAGWSPLAALPAAVAATALVALVLGIVSVRLAGHYLVIGTMAWGIGLYYVFGGADILGGFSGIAEIPTVKVMGQDIRGTVPYYFLIWLFVAFFFLAATNLMRSRIGRGLRCLRMPAMAESFGINVPALRLLVFVSAAVMCGAAGWLQAHYIRLVNPAPFNVISSIDYMFMVVMGGSTQLLGALLGPFLMEGLRHLLRDLVPWVVGSSGKYELVLFGGVLLVVMQRARQGLAPLIVARLPPRPPLTVEPAARPLPQRGAAPLTARPLLEVRNATKRFGGLTAVNQVSFEIRSDEIVGLIGPNGAGKSTLFNLLTGVAPLTSGEVAYRGERIDALSSRRIGAKGMSRTFQHVLLQPAMSVLENAAIGAHRRSGKNVLHAVFRLNRDEERALLSEAMRQLHRVGLGHLAHVPAGSLALGQQRLLEVARALAADPELLMLDEPAAGLRHGEKQALAALLKELRSEGVAILIVEHDMDFVMNLVDRLIVMEFGSLIAQGTPSAIQENPRVIAAYLGAEDPEDAA